MDSIVEGHRSSPMQVNQVDTFLDAYSKVFETANPTALKQLRDEHCKEHVQILRGKKAVLRELSKRILIWEQADETFVVAQVIHYMKLRHHIPVHSSPVVIAF